MWYPLQNVNNDHEFMRKAEGARFSATSIRRALTEGALCLPKRLTYDLELMAPGARHQKST